MSTKNSKFLKFSKKYSFFKKFYYFYNIYIRNYKFYFQGSQFGEDKKILKLFGKNYIGKYLDVGCFHPTRSNNTLLMFKKGWSGLNIDLNPLAIELFNFARPKDINICAALSSKKTKKKLYFLGDLDSKNTIDTNHKNWLKKHFRIKNSDILTKNITTTTLEALLDKNDFFNIDFMNIDIEGNELEVLKSFNFKKFEIKVICIEMISYNKYFKNRKKKLIQILKKNRYRLVDKSEFNYIFKKIY